MKQGIAAGVIVILLIAGSVFFILSSERSGAKPNKSSSTTQTQTEDGTSGDQESVPTEIPTQTMDTPKMTIDAKKNYSAVLHTSKGDITIALHAIETPNTVNNFVTLSNKHFYDKTIFHRTINGFMIQGGDPKGDGTGGPGYRFNDEQFTGDYDRGVVAMANAGPNTNGSQFFIMHQKQDLPHNYVIFGNVTKGIEVVDMIAQAPTEMSNSGEDSKPVSPVSVTSVDIIEN